VCTRYSLLGKDQKNVVDAVAVTGSRPAALYTFTSDSRFNAEMNGYMVDGAIIEPPRSELDLIFNSSSNVSLEILDTSTGERSAYLIDSSDT